MCERHFQRLPHRIKISDEQQYVKSRSALTFIKYTQYGTQSHANTCFPFGNLSGNFEYISVVLGENIKTISDWVKIDTNTPHQRIIGTSSAEIREN